MKHTIYKSRDFLRPSQVVQKRRRRRVIRLVVFLVLAISIIVSLVLVMRMDFLKIQAVTIRGNVTIKTEDLTESVQNIISCDYLYFLPKSNILIFPKNKIIADLAHQFSRIDTLKVSIEKNILEISMTERKPHSLWCGTSFSQGVDPCFFIDSQGYVFAEAPQFDGASYFKLYGSTPTAPIASSTEDILPDGNTPVPAWQFISEKKYLDIENFVNSVKSLGIELSAVELLDENNYKFQIKNNGLLMTSLDVSLVNTFENLKAGLTNDIFWITGKNNQKKLSQVEYIDMRYGNKIFYKLSGQ